MMADKKLKNPKFGYIKEFFIPDDENQNLTEQSKQEQNEQQEKSRKQDTEKKKPQK